MPSGLDDDEVLPPGVRAYSPAFEGLGGKWQKALTVGEELVRALASEYEWTLEHLELHEPDPPDLTCRWGGQRIALEITELVCSRTVAINEKRRHENLRQADPRLHQGPVYREWRQVEVCTALSTLLYRKDSKVLHGQHDALWVCVFTDEFMLTPQAVAKMVEETRFGPFNKISKAFLLFSHQPGRSTYPLVPLQLIG